jgi:hypothetical protein
MPFLQPGLPLSYSESRKHDFLMPKMKRQGDNPMPPQLTTRVLGVLVKQPTAGLVKSRLASQTSPEWAARVAQAFLTDTLDRLAVIEARKVLVYAPAEAKSFFQRWPAIALN